MKSTESASALHSVWSPSSPGTVKQLSRRVEVERPHSRTPGAVASDGVVLVADHGNSRVRTLTLPSTETLRVELRNISPLLPAGCSMIDSATSVFHWTVELRVPLRGGTFTLSLEMPFDYPVGKPVAKLVPPIPNQKVNSETGEMEGLGEWDRTKRVLSIVQAVHALLMTSGLVDCRNNTLMALHQRISIRAPDGSIFPPSLEDKDGGVVVNRTQTLSLPSKEPHIIANFITSSLGTARLQSELANISSLLPPGCYVTRSAASLFQWVALLHMMKGPFRGGLFELSVEMPFDYPVGSPLIKFVPPITHPSVHPHTGEVIVKWDKTDEDKTSIVEALRQVQGLLEYPFMFVSMNSNKVQFDKQAYEAARQSWHHKLKPSDANELICELLCPPKHISQEAQHVPRSGRAGNRELHREHERASYDSDACRQRTI